MKVLHVSPFYEPAWGYGGVARAAAELCRSLTRRGDDITVVTTRLSAQDAAVESDGGVEIRRFDSPRLMRSWLVPWAPSLGRFLAERASEFDLAHLHGHRNGLAVTARRRLERAGIPWVLQPHGTFPDHAQFPLAKRVFDALWGRRTVSGASALLAVSRAEALDLPRASHVVGNGVCSVGVAPLPGVQSAHSLLFVGSSRAQKRGSVLVELLRELPEATLTLVGRFSSRFLGPFRSFGSRVLINGVLGGDELQRAYCAARVVLHPAVGEAFGFVPFEAALAGTPAIVAGGHGCGEWFGAAGGCVVPPDDLRALVEATKRRLTHPEHGRREAVAVATFARRELTWDAVAASVAARYRDVAGLAQADS